MQIILQRKDKQCTMLSTPFLPLLFCFSLLCFLHSLLCAISAVRNTNAKDAKFLMDLVDQFLACFLEQGIFSDTMAVPQNITAVVKLVRNPMRRSPQEREVFCFWACFFVGLVLGFGIFFFNFYFLNKIHSLCSPVISKKHDRG